MKHLSIIMLLWLFVTPGFASYNAKGWQWYRVPAPKKEVTMSSDQTNTDVESTNKEDGNYRDQITAFQEIYAEAQARAVVTRDVKDVAYAMQLRQFMMEQSKEYGVAFQKALLLYPELSHQLKFPTQENARAIAYDVEQQHQKIAIDRFTENHGLFFFYQGKDVYAKGMAATVQRFCDKHQMTLIGIPVDGVALDDIKINNTASDQFKTWGVKAMPALFLYNNSNKSVQPFSYGFISGNQIAHQFLQLATDYGQKSLAGDTNDA